jgi:hypothetical protein
MADTERPQDGTALETDAVDANLAIEQGLGVGARELAAQRDAGGVVTEDVEPGEEKADALDRNTAVQGDEKG